MLNFGGGMIANVGSGANFFIRFLGYVSPVRYGCELLMCTIMKGMPILPLARKTFGYEFEHSTCLYCLGGFFLFSFIAGWIMIIARSKMSS